MSFTRNLLRSVAHGVASVVNDSPVPYVSSRGFGGLRAGSANNKASQLHAMGSVGTLFAIVNRTSVDTAAVDWHLHRLAQRAPRTSSVCELCEQPGVTLVTQHPALSVWENPNNFYTRQELVESGQQHIDLTGEGWLVIAKIGNRPIELWPVRPDRIKPIPHPTKFLSGYVYFGPDGEKVPLGLDEVIQIRMPNPEDPYRGMGPVQAILHDLDASKYSAEWINKFFENGAEPGGIIEIEKSLDDNEFKQMKQRWQEGHQGVSNAHRVAILEQGKWVDRNFSQRDMQFAELRNVGREIIREAFGMHGHMLGLSEDVNRANADAAEVTNARHQTIPRLGRWKQALNHDFLKLFGDMGKGYEFAHCNPVPEDVDADNATRASKTTGFKTLVDAGVDPVDAASVCGLPAMNMRAISVPAPVPAGTGA